MSDPARGLVAELMTRLRTIEVKCAQLEQERLDLATVMTSYRDALMELQGQIQMLGQIVGARTEPPQPQSKPKPKP